MESSINILLLTWLFIFCGIAIYTDIKYGIIKNTNILVGASVGFLLNSLNIILYEEWESFLINSLLVIIIAVLLYICHVWAGGDCKFVIFIALSTPTDLYWNMNNNIYNYYYMYIFIFLIGWIYICFDSIKRLVEGKCNISKKS